MKINNPVGNESVVKNAYLLNRMDGGARAGEAVKVENGSINASKLSLFDDDIANKKQKALQDAMKFVREQYGADSKIDDTIESCRARSAESRESLKEAQEEIAALEEEKQQALEGYDEGSEEYKTIAKEYEERKEIWAEQKENAEKDIMVQAGTIRGIKQEMLKQHGMVDAVKAEEMTLEAAAKEIAGMLIEEAREKIEEDIKEAVEKGEEQKAEKEEAEAKLEEIQAEQEKKAQEAEKSAEEYHNNVRRKDSSGLNMEKFNQKYQEVVEQAERLLAEQQMMMEEIKGISVDSLL